MFRMFTCFVLCVLLTGIAQAGSTVVTPQLYDPSVGFNVNVTYGRNGSLPGATDLNTSSSPQFTSPGSVPAYCSDPWHENVLGSPYTVVSAYGADFFAAEHSGNLFQDLVTVGSVPEPTTALLGSVGLVVVALWAKFRKRSA